MRVIYTKLVVDMETGRVIESVGYLYSGEVEEAKKGRETQQAISQQELQQTQHDQQIRDAQLAKAEPFLGSLEATAPGQMSPFAKSQYGSDVENIAKTYGDVRRNGLRAIGLRGFGNAPTGMLGSMMNSAGNAQGADETNAYENAMRQTYGEQLEAAKARMGLISTYDPTKPANVASESAARQLQQGSLLGDIGGGLSTAAGLAKASMGLAKEFNG